MYTTHFKGLLGELEFTLHLIKCGYTILKPINNNSSYDLVIEKNNSFLRVQIKFCTPNNGRLRVELRRPKRKTKNYKDREVDAMGVYDALNKKFYLIPITEINTKSEVWIRVSDPRNYQKKRINQASKYEVVVE
ncbi:hypothetical protein A3J15_03125 [Candidatus Roizmanbacteria bacterium RIFCSPLOWO2_02_FULL_38_10]|uniref:PD(D/E)XK endonuclease domain-containing protein n=1 Tax=Candidatus Roizmanbacteria bacterium RIFCSPLOWO2_02_FULL_38_10 TaxID=1802074 RepID=A0A1F7JLK8_9BACT|nr:MAG: hypothetical protein A3J15_03125 [Candidatus Roizmanbacteria bacterium RIFCSPLOWO2_02_FULL_38_10]